MNLHAIVAPYTRAVNPATIGDLYSSDGYSITASGKQNPLYLRYEGVTFDVQALSGKDLAHVDALNLQGVVRKVYANGNVQGVNRVETKGGDVLYFDEKFWLVTVVFETWDRPGWCAVGVTLQNVPAELTVTVDSDFITVDTTTITVDET